MIPHLTDGAYPLRAGNQVRYWIDGVDFYQRLEEAIDAAQSCVLGVISFIQPSFSFLSGRSLWSVLQQAASRGVAVQLVVWCNPHFFLSGHILQGTDEERAMLRASAPDVQIRWDASPTKEHCHHQKTWIVDDAAFVGGMVLSNSTLEDRAHTRHPNGKHDSFVEIHGGAVQDVYHNFAQRWNASTLLPSHPNETQQVQAERASALIGEASVQVSRTIKRGLYGSSGESDIWAQYQLAFAHAKRSIYIENQHPGEERLLLLLRDALRRGVEVLYVVPGQPMRAISEARAHNDPRYASTFLGLDALEAEPGFTLAALSTETKEVYVHSKLCIVDGEWVTIGSANLVDISLCADHTEINVSIWEQTSAMLLLLDLYQEHAKAENGEQGTGNGLDQTGTEADEPDSRIRGMLVPGSGINPGDDKEMVRAMRELARDNTKRREQKQSMQGHLYALRPTKYAR
jgi:cardiolipin synthase